MYNKEYVFIHEGVSVAKIRIFERKKIKRLFNTIVRVN